VKHFINVMFGLSKEVHKFETDPVEQYHFHLFFTWFWILAMIGVIFIVPHKTGPEQVALIILEVSLWANFVSHFTAVGASIAGIYASHQEEILEGHLVRGFFGRIKHKKIKLPIFSNPNYQPPTLLAEDPGEGSTAWLDELKNTTSDLPEYEELHPEDPLEQLVPLPSEPVIPIQVESEVSAEQ